MKEVSAIIDTPNYWPKNPLGEVARSINSGFPCGDHNRAGHGVPHLRPMNISPKGEITLSDVKYVEEEYEPLRKGDVLFNNTNSPVWVGKTAYISRNEEWAYSNHMTRLRGFGDDVYPKWISHWLQTLQMFGYFQLHCRNHVNQASIGISFLEELPIPLPPLPEQRRIVAKIEELFSNLDAGMGELSVAEQQLERYRLSVLQAAVEGRLTADWRRTHNPEPADQLLERILEERRTRWEKDYRAKYEAKGKDMPRYWKKRYSEPDNPDAGNLPLLPDGWTWTNVENACIVYGGVTKNARKGGDLVEMPYLRVANVYANELRLDEIKKIKVKRNRLYKYFLEEGDLLVVEGNGSKSQIGRVARWDGSVESCVHQNHLIKVRPIVKETGRYLLWWLLSPNGRRHITRVASSTSGLYTLSMTKVRSIPVPLPPLAEQRQIVAEVERLLSVADDASATTKQEQTRAERLRQSILKQAFRGCLVDGSAVGASMTVIGGDRSPKQKVLDFPGS